MEKVCLDALRQNHKSWNYISEKLKKNIMFQKTAVREQPLLLEVVDDSIKEDENIWRDLLK